jgi:hypothetical protein
VPACCCELCGLGRGRFILQRRVRPSGVVAQHPLGDRLPGLVQREEQGLVQQLVPHLAIEALDIAVLHGLPQHDVVPHDALFLYLGEDGMRVQLGSVVVDDHAGPASPFDESRAPLRRHAWGAGRALRADAQNPNFPAQCAVDIDHRHSLGRPAASIRNRYYLLRDVVRSTNSRIRFSM